MDADTVVREAHYAAKQFPTWPEEQRIRCGEVLANRLNVWRAVRNLILPTLADIESTLASLHAKMDRVEQALSILAQRHGS